MFSCGGTSRGKGFEDKEKDIDPKSPRHQWEASETKLAGCSRRYLAGLSCDDEERGEYFLLEDDLVADHGNTMDSFLRARRGGNISCRSITSGAGALNVGKEEA